MNIVLYVCAAVCAMQLHHICAAQYLITELGLHPYYKVMIEY